MMKTGKIWIVSSNSLSANLFLIITFTATRLSSRTTTNTDDQ